MKDNKINDHSFKWNFTLMSNVYAVDLIEKQKKKNGNGFTFQWQT